LPLLTGSAGEAVRDLQIRLAKLGLDATGDEPGSFGDATFAAVSDFQRRRGLTTDGECGQETWSALVEAGYGSGDRLLYLRQPMLRGDDVATVQQRLGSLGFNAGRVDGMFGPRTAEALKDFQRNLGLTVDGVCGPATLQALDRLGARCATAKTVVESVRELERLRAHPPTLAGRRIVICQLGGLDFLVAAIARLVRANGADVVTVVRSDGSEHAAEANAVGADGVVALLMRPDVSGCGTSFYARAGYESAAGRLLAELVQDRVPAALGVADEGVHGMSLPLLRETRMPAVVITIGPGHLVVEHAGQVAGALTAALISWASGDHVESDVDPRLDGETPRT